MMKMDWKTSLGTVALYSVGGAAAGYYAVGAEHSSSAAVEKTFVAAADRTRGAQRGGMIGGLFGLGLVGLFGALSSKGTQRLLGVAGAAIGLGGTLYSLNKFRSERTAESTQSRAQSAAPIQAQTPAIAESMANQASTTPAQLQAESDAATAAALDAALGPVGEPISDAELLAAGGNGMNGLGRLAAMRRRGAAPFNPRYYR